ncbi:hypothetical protein HanHA300_Chr17g0664821 [Helianthus annuus]|nr:hypothetical protein HanHA300_Chr17g0664821 [Helianthus annuus]KAJ0637184.1 hypothetical protein HanOQP8_Chr17g0670781 [Helianthus annuus]
MKTVEFLCMMLVLEPEEATVNDGMNLMEVNTKKNTRESFTC